jgi:outer membrane biosynthesis protein TonB
MSPARRKGYVLKYRVSHAAVAGASAGPYAIAETIGGHSARWRWPTAFAATLALHALFVFLAFVGDKEHGAKAKPVEQVVTLERPPPAPEETPPPEPPPPPRHPRPTASAEAGKVVAAAVDPNQPVDMTSFTMPVGTSDAYAGGFTAPAGTSSVAVAEPVRAVRPSGKARAAGPARRDWSCPWPEEEQSGDLHDASVHIRIHVGVDGRATAVDVLASPKDSFAEAARACALSEPFRPELDDAGHPVVGLTPPISVHFVR